MLKNTKKISIKFAYYIIFFDYYNGPHMAKQTTTLREMSLKYSKDYKDEFCMGLNDKLYCKLCNVYVDPSKKWNIVSHRKSKKHEQAFSLSRRSEQTFFDHSPDSLTRLIVQSFASADIPLKKLEHQSIRHMFNILKAPVVSTTNARLHLNKIYEENVLKLIDYFENKYIFLVVDESEIKKTKYFNVLAGSIDDPLKIYFLDSIYCDTSINSFKVCSMIKETLEKYNIELKNVDLVISDAARYMVKAITELKLENNTLLHIQCLAHLIHNCAMKIRGYYKNVDTLIAAIKGITHKNKTNSALFENLGLPPSVIITRWSSWLKAVEYYSTNLPEIRKIVNAIPDGGILIKNAKDALENTSVHRSLFVIQKSYACLITILENFEHSSYNVDSGYLALANLSINEDPVNIVNYIKERLDKNDIQIIATISNENISPLKYVSLKKCQPTSISVERSFSMLKKMLAKDRNFKPENVTKYMSLYYNDKILNDIKMEFNDEGSHDERDE